ncbi:hypothetical protein SLA2020_430010 [Shorea laevis]
MKLLIINFMGRFDRELAQGGRRPNLAMKGLILCQMNVFDLLGQNGIKWILNQLHVPRLISWINKVSCLKLRRARKPHQNFLKAESISLQRDLVRRKRNMVKQARMTKALKTFALEKSIRSSANSSWVSGGCFAE